MPLCSVLIFLWVVIAENTIKYCGVDGAADKDDDNPSVQLARLTG